MALMLVLVPMLAAWWTNYVSVAVPIKLKVDIDGKGKIPDLIRDYLNSRNFVVKTKKTPNRKYSAADDAADLLQLWAMTTTTAKPKVDGSCKKTNVIVLPMLNVVAEPKEAVGILKALGVADAPTIYADGKLDFNRNRDKLMSLFSLPLFNRCCQQKANETEIHLVNDEPDLCTTTTQRPCRIEVVQDEPEETIFSSQLCRRHLEKSKSRQPTSSIFPPNSALFLDAFTPKDENCDISEDSKDCSYDAENSKQMTKLVVYVDRDHGPVTFAKAIELCSKRGMMLPIIRDQVDFDDLRNEVDNNRTYWIGLGKSECRKQECAYEWVDGVKDAEYLASLLMDDGVRLKPKTGPMEFCSISLPNGKQRVSVECYTDVETTAYYICTHNPPTKNNTVN